MFRTHTCGELNLQSAGQEVTLSGWVQRIRDKGGLIWIDLRDRYGITQLMMEEGSSDPAVIAKAKELGREFVIQAKGLVIERISKNLKIPTGEIEIKVVEIKILTEHHDFCFSVRQNGITVIAAIVQNLFILFY